MNKTFREALEHFKKEYSENNFRRNVFFLYPREELLAKFVDRLNQDRTSAGYEPIRAAYVVTKMYDAGITTDFLLSWFYGYCNDAKNFSACWWWSLKSDNANKKNG